MSMYYNFCSNSSGISISSSLSLLLAVVIGSRATLGEILSSMNYFKIKSMNNPPATNEELLLLLIKLPKFPTFFALPL